MKVEDKIAVITGGASGIGFNCGEQLLLSNAKFIAVFDLPSQNAVNAVGKLKDKFGKDRADFFPCDVTNHDQVESSFDKVMQLFGSFDILINGAGIVSYTNWEQTINVNFVGVTRTTLKAFDLIGKHKGGKGGTIVNIASIAGLTPAFYLPIYSATKHAVVSLTNGLHLSYDKSGIRMMVMCPGFTTTPLTASLRSEEYLTFIDRQAYLKHLEQQGSQTPECVGKAIVELLEKGENGAACVVRVGKPPYLVRLPTIFDLPARLL